jgi:hypothetical protein
VDNERRAGSEGGLSIGGEGLAIRLPGGRLLPPELATARSVGVTSADRAKWLEDRKRFADDLRRATGEAFADFVTGEAFADFVTGEAFDDFVTVLSARSRSA